MARRGDLFGLLGTLNEERTTPYWAVLAVGAVNAALATIGNVRTTWSFSAFAVLISLRADESRRVAAPRSATNVSALDCRVRTHRSLALAFWVERRIWLTGLELIGIGLLWHAVAQRRHQALAARKLLR
jgi:APA family basic amino acid/polyamine antiporter